MGWSGDRRRWAGRAAGGARFANAHTPPRSLAPTLTGLAAPRSYSVQGSLALEYRPDTPKKGVAAASRAVVALARPSWDVPPPTPYSFQYSFFPLLNIRSCRGRAEGGGCGRVGWGVGGLGGVGSGRERAQPRRPALRPAHARPQPSQTRRRHPPPPPLPSSRLDVHPKVGRLRRELVRGRLQVLDLELGRHGRVVGDADEVGGLVQGGDGGDVELGLDLRREGVGGAREGG